MNLGDISVGMVFAALLYVITLPFGLNFIFSNLSYGGLTPDFWLLALIILLPVILAALYLTRGGIEFLYGKEAWLKRLIFVSIIIAALAVMVLIVPLSY